MIYVINGHPGDLLANPLLPDCAFGLREDGDRTIVEYPNGQTAVVPTKLIRKLSREGLLQEAPLPPLRGYKTAAEAVEVVKGYNVRKDVPYRRFDDPAVLCWFVGFTAEQHEEDDSFEINVILEDDSRNHRSVWFSNFVYEYEKMVVKQPFAVK